MHSHWRQILITMVVLLALVGSVGAQAAVDPDLLNDVATAFSQTAAVDSLHLQAQSLTETKTGDQSSFGAVLTSNYDFVRSGDSWNVSGSQTTDTTTPNGSFQSTTDMIVIDGTTYMRIQRDASADANDAPQGQGGGFSLPEGWFDLTALQAENQGQQGGGRAFLADGSLPSSLLDLLSVPVSASAVTALSELPSDSIDGQPMRVFQVTFNSQALLDSDAASLARGGAVRGGFVNGGPGGFGAQPPTGDGTQAPGGGFGPGQGQPQDQLQGQPADGAAQLDIPPTVDPADVSVTFAVYIGADGLIHRIYSVVATSITPAADATTSLTTTTTAQTDFTAFNQPATITAPEIGT
ncbi:MAG: hypothetical protein IT320_21695 [Anaerolineae bacterium]|nr:hypothetical protein [Anaerolineae bacterium]